ncbi:MULTISPECIES: AAA family ATPase [unclassified Yoonia]|uniref:AAA family ATPase n=1 Tax=unclassified Yoonia TaxID=2629118 RepID=UPI002AFE8133|nr:MULTISPECIES: AAA family ATPase [unclassified Yoonia]
MIGPDPIATASGETSGVSVWLEGIGLGLYDAAFARADVDLEVLPHLTDADLRELGISSVGHRRKVLANLPLARGAGRPADAGAELRYLTVVFCDLVGSTRLAAGLGAESFADLLDRVYAAVDRAAEAFGGQVAQYHGDGALTYFGYPEALEDAAQRGVLAACRMVKAVADLRVPGEPQVALVARAGVASGLVVVDGRPGMGPDRSGRAFGVTVNLAASLQGVAAPGAVVLSETTAGLVRDHITLQPLGSRQLKGIETPIALYKASCPGSLEPSMVIRTRPVRVPLSGRAAERALIERHWEQVCGEGFAHVTVRGEPGIGKTRLVADYLDAVESRGHVVQRLACHSRALDIPFFPFLVALRRESASGCSNSSKMLDRLETAAEGDWHERRRRRTETIAALAEHFAGKRKPAVLWLEDLQWADPSTIEILTALVSRRPSGLLVITTTRTPADRTSNDAEIRLGRLGPDETRQIVARLLGGSGQAAGAALVEALVRRSEGVPIFAEELALDLRARLEAAVPSDQADVAALVPSSLVQLLQARIGRLTVARPLMRIIATLDRSIPTSVLRDLWTGPDRLEAALDELAVAGLAELTIGQGEEENRLNIRHQLIADCAYAMILKRDRPRLHSANADALAARQARGILVLPRLRADQLERAGRLREAAVFWAEAGRAAAAQSADAEAAGLLRHALDLVPQLGPDDHDWSRKFEADTLLALYPTMTGAFGYLPAGNELSARLSAMIAGVGGADRVLAALFVQWIDRIVQGDIDGAHELVVGLSPVVLAENRDLHSLVIHRLVGSTHMFRGEFHEARFHLSAFIADYRPADHAEPLRAFGATENLSTVLSCLAAMEAITGTSEATEQAVSAALSAAQATGHPHTLCHTLAFGAALPAAIRCDWVALAAHGKRLSAIADDHELGFWRHFAAMIDGIVIAATGATKAGRLRFDEGHAALKQRGMRFMGPSFRLCLAQADTAGLVPADVKDISDELAKGERWLLPAARVLEAAMLRQS